MNISIHPGQKKKKCKGAGRTCSRPSKGPQPGEQARELWGGGTREEQADGVSETSRGSEASRYIHTSHRFTGRWFHSTGDIPDRELTGR